MLTNIGRFGMIQNGLNQKKIRLRSHGARAEIAHDSQGSTKQFQPISVPTATTPQRRDPRPSVGLVAGPEEAEKILSRPPYAQSITPRGAKPCRLLSNWNLVLTFQALSIARAHMFIRNCSIRRMGGNISVDLCFFNNKKFIHLPVLYKFGSIYEITPLSTQRKGWST